LDMENGSSLSANSVNVAGGAYQANSNNIPTSELHTPSSRTGDPYSTVNATLPSGTVQPTITNGSPAPGKYAGIDVNGTVNLSAGTYYIDSGNFIVEQNSTLNAPSGTTIVLTSSGSTYGYMDIRQNATVTLTAPTSGDFSGIAVYQDRNASPSVFVGN